MKTTQLFAASSCTAGKLALLSAALFTASAPVLAAPVTPQKADRFVDSMGINTHWNYSSYQGPGTTRYAQVKAKLQELGLRHVRDNALQPSIDASLDLWNTLGVKTTFICGRKVSGSLRSSQIDAELDSLEPVAAAIAAIEGPNEYDDQSPDSETNWAFNLVDYQKKLYAAANNSSLHAPLVNIPVIGPSVISEGAANAVYAANGNANLSAHMDYKCLHMYQSSRWPGNTGYGNNGYGSIDWGINLIGVPVGGSKPIQSTESGYNTGRTSEDRYVLPDVEARYLPRMFAEFFRRGFFRSFKYELVDEASDNGFGLMDSSLNVRPAFTAIKNLVTAMKDPSPSTNFTPTALDYTLSGANSDTRQMLFQKSDGSYYLMLWREISSMDPNSKTAIVNSTDTVTLALPSSITSVSTNLPKDNTTFSSVAISSGQVTLSVPDHLMIVRLASSGVTTSLSPVGDSFVNDGTPTTTRGNETAMLAKTISGSGANRWAYTKFDTTGRGTISSAKLRVYGNLTNSVITSMNVAVYGNQFTSSSPEWGESTLTWNNKPLPLSTALATRTITGTGRTMYEFDVTSFVQSEVSAGRRKFGLVLKSTTTNTDPSVTFNTKEATSDKPVLVVVGTS